jgi:hypothetical protein
MGQRKWTNEISVECWKASKSYLVAVRSTVVPALGLRGDQQ